MGSSDFILILAAVALSIIPLCSSIQHDATCSDDIGFIQNDFTTTIEKNPWHVSLTLLGVQYCAGAIINERFVLTAAHCVEEEVIEMMVIGTNSTGIADHSGHWQPAKQIIRHELYKTDPTRIIPDYDIALVELSEPLQFGKGTAPIKLAESDVQFGEGKLIHVIGRGRPNDSGSAPLQETYVPVFNQEQCEEAYVGAREINEGMFCMGYNDGTNDACNADAGGPIVENEELVAMISCTKGCATRLPGVYMRLGAFHDWVKMNLYI